MPKIILKNRHQNIEYETKNKETINDIKDIIRQRLDKKEADIKIVFQGKIVNGSVPLSCFCDGDIFDYVIKTDEVEMTSIDNTVTVKIHNEKRQVQSSDIISKNGKMYLIVRREKRKSLQEEIRAIVSNLKIDIVVKIAMIIAFFVSDNKELAYLFSGLLAMRMANQMKFKLKMNGSGLNQFLRILLSFFISLFMLNSEEILDFNGCKNRTE